TSSSNSSPCESDLELEADDDQVAAHALARSATAVVRVVAVLRERDGGAGVVAVEEEVQADVPALVHLEALAARIEALVADQRLDAGLQHARHADLAREEPAQHAHVGL